MPSSDPFDVSTIGAEPAGKRHGRLASWRFVFRGAQGIVDEPARVLTPGETLVGRLRASHGSTPVLTLVDDAQASRRHAVLRYRRDPCSLSVEDTASRNGVRVNGKQVEQAQLADGDVVRLGASIAVVRYEDPRQRDVAMKRLLGNSPAMQRVRTAVARMARVSASLLITGETGVGKEVVARAIHRASGRSGPFVAVNGSAMTESLADSLLFGHIAGAFTGADRDQPGFFRAAEGGTLLLDEIGDMPMALQAKLLRALETRAVTPVGSTTPIAFDARVLAATNVLGDDGCRGTLREDLYARLAQLQLHIAPLRQRREDVLALLAPHLVGLPPMSPELAEALVNAYWRGNVREVLAVASELRVWAGDASELDLQLLPKRLLTTPPPSSEQPRRASIDDNDGGGIAVPDAAALRDMLHEHHGNVAAIAKRTGRSRAQVYRWMRRHGLSADDFRVD